MRWAVKIVKAAVKSFKTFQQKEPNDLAGNVVAQHMRAVSHICVCICCWCNIHRFQLLKIKHRYWPTPVRFMTTIIIAVWTRKRVNMSTRRLTCRKCHFRFSLSTNHESTDACVSEIEGWAKGSYQPVISKIDPISQHDAEDQFNVQVMRAAKMQKEHW